MFSNDMCDPEAEIRELKRQIPETEDAYVVGLGKCQVVYQTTTMSCVKYGDALKVVDPVNVCKSEAEVRQVKILRHLEGIRNAITETI